MWTVNHSTHKQWEWDCAKIKGITLSFSLYCWEKYCKKGFFIVVSYCTPPISWLTIWLPTMQICPLQRTFLNLNISQLLHTVKLTPGTKLFLSFLLIPNIKGWGLALIFGIQEDISTCQNNKPLPATLMLPDTFYYEHNLESISK